MGKTFFVVTDNKSFWDMDSDTLVFASRGLLRYNTQDGIRRKYNLDFLKPIYENNVEQKALQDYLHTVERRITPYIVETLNTYNHCNYDQTSWELLVHTWIYEYINQMYRCFSNVRIAKKMYPNIVFHQGLICMTKSLL